ncbi:MAG: MFS transporter, partial [Gammaproteobacteria bacterium]
MSRKVLFGFAEMPLQVAMLAITAYIPNYYGMDLGVSLASVATVLMIARLFDAVTDPLVGYLSDRT